MSDNQTTYIELHGIAPEDIPYGDEWDGNTLDAGSDLANDIYQLIQEEYPFDVDGVATVVNEDAHEQLNEAFD